ncbi:MAG: tetratricopeptide repeat protein [Gammaproteobacteria bacterium]
MSTATTALHPEHKDILAVLGYFFLEHGQTDKALILLEALDTLCPKEEEVAKSLSYAYLQAGRYQDALDAAARAAAARDDIFIHLLRGKALWGLGKTTEARACLQRYCEERTTP